MLDNWVNRQTERIFLEIYPKITINQGPGGRPGVGKIGYFSFFDENYQFWGFEPSTAQYLKNGWKWPKTAFFRCFWLFSAVLPKKGWKRPKIAYFRCFWPFLPKNGWKWPKTAFFRCFWLFLPKISVFSLFWALFSHFGVFLGCLGGGTPEFALFWPVLAYFGTFGPFLHFFGLKMTKIGAVLAGNSPKKGVPGGTAFSLR